MLPTLVYSQPQYINLMEQNDVILGYYKVANLYDYRLTKNHTHNRNITQLCFFDTFSDSVSIYLNEKLVVSKWFIPSKNYKTTNIIIKRKGKESSYVMVVLHNTRKYIEFPLDIRFRFVELHYRFDTINKLDYWNVNFTNNVPHRD